MGRVDVGRGGRGRGGKGDDSARLGVRLGEGRVVESGSGRGRLGRAGKEGATERGRAGNDGAAAGEGEGAADGGEGRDVAGVGRGRVSGVQLRPGLTWETDVVDMIEDTEKVSATVVPRESWVIGMGREGGVEAKSWQAVVAPFSMQGHAIQNARGCTCDE